MNQSWAVSKSTFLSLTLLVAQNPFVRMLKACNSGDTKALLHHYIIHLHKFTPSGVGAQSLAQKMGRKSAVNAQPAIASQTIKLRLKVDRFIVIAAMRCYSFEKFERLWRKGVDGDENWWLGYAMLHAISACKHRVVEFFLDEGADPNSTVRLDGHGPLALAAVKGSERILNSLIRKGAVVKGSGAFEAAGKYGQTKITKALIFDQRQAEIARRGMAEHWRDWFPMKVEWNKCPILPDELIQGDMTNALVLATEAGHEAVVDLLLTYGVNPAGKDANGRSALQVAQSEWNTRLVIKLELWLPNYLDGLGTLPFFRIHPL